MVDRSYTSDKSYSGVEHLLRWVDGRSWQFYQNTVAVVKSQEHKCRDQLRSNLTTDVDIGVFFLSRILHLTTDK